jgi:NADH-quinone oxidoreductase subunit L
MRYLAWIPLLPAFGALLNGIVGIRYFGKRTAGWLACATVGVSFVLSAIAFFELLRLPPDAREHVVTLGTWIPPIALQTARGLGTYAIDWAFRLDPLSSLMLLVVTGIGFLIHVYSTAYMDEESPGAYARYFSYLNLFAAFMLTLVLGANFLVMFVGWEGVGLCSYLLIGYWYEKKSASDAGKKAFLVNRIGDFGFILGMFLVFFTFGTLDFRQVADLAGTMPVETAAFGTLSAITLLLFVGATGKSAQIPLYVWLPDAMEGPTPVSALIHAATMVTAGVYMVCRTAVLFTHAPQVMLIVAVIGALTALMAATIGLVQNDIKRVLAYSTVSQLGYMFLATGVGAFAAGAFHLMTHAFFKALLFLGSGSVIRAMHHEQDMRRMGALRPFLRTTFWTMAIGTLAIAGIPIFAGFFSKDEILYRTFLGNRALWVLAVITAALTAFYMSRLMAMTFFGAYRGPEFPSTRAEDGARSGQAPSTGHPHDDHHAGHGSHHDWHGPRESPRAMTVPLMVLAAGAVVAGFVGVPAALGGANHIEHFLAPSFEARPVEGIVPSVEAWPVEGVAHAPAHVQEGAVPSAPGHAAAPAEAEPHAAPGHGAGPAHLSTAGELGLMVFSVLVAVAGILLARRNYVTSPEASDRMAERFAGAHRVLLNKYYVDELYDATAVRGVMSGARASWGFDRIVVDGMVNGSAFFTRISAWFSGLFDRMVVDGMVDTTGSTLREASHGFRRLQTGLVQNYALLMIVGVFAFVGAYLILR